MKTSNLGYPRIGAHRELKRACEKYWSNKISLEDLVETGKSIRAENWKLQQEKGIDLVPSNDFSFYDQVLDTTLMVGAIPERYKNVQKSSKNLLDLYFAMARGLQKDGVDVIAMEMTKWFDTNYHYIVPEFIKDQEFEWVSQKVVEEFKEAKNLGIHTKPVLLGPVTYLLLGKEKEEGFHRLDLLQKLIPVYHSILKELLDAGATWVQFDEPILSTDLSSKEQEAIGIVYNGIAESFPNLKILLASYFGDYGDNLDTVLDLPVCALHLDLKRGQGQLDNVLESEKLKENTSLSLGVVDGRNVWKNDFETSLQFIQKAKEKLGEERIIVSPSCSLLHVPYDLELEENERILSAEIKDWMAFAKQKLEELQSLKILAKSPDYRSQKLFLDNAASMERRGGSKLIHKPKVKHRLEQLEKKDYYRESPFAKRKILQEEHLKLPLFPTTTIGSFPQTQEVRRNRSMFKKGELQEREYVGFLMEKTTETIRLQEEIGLDVPVHGEFERNDMVEYFGEQLEGFTFTQNGWVQSYGSRCVKPPIIYGDVSRPVPMTVFWTSFAQSLTDKPVKGMLTGPVTILQWSFVRDDQARSATCEQIALAILDEVLDLEKEGISIIQVDEPAIREGLPLRKKDWGRYLDWAIGAFKLSTSGVKDSTQIHTHMCYSEFNDIIQSIADMDADVITIECSRSQMELLDAFYEFDYPNDIGPGVYDIHSPRVPSEEEIVKLLQKAEHVLPASKLWVNPDCGLKTRGWEETINALKVMVSAAQQMRETVGQPSN
ncbi:5-methyltetrahydropteroyltriglutamate--homocysteine S-methyltransferase [Muricauda oceani]|uniref:5-methyltetrahydropteroyltriglutamate--homocysteine methyltransferase n=1 Tax=Flagellimonas oceani TaxID=2698672 RepID=A0A6G7J2E1_9FLAO|nr:5-methyltetrahydropteroyltriglutamate--homocysteine S-methyltransferase [Allomuricauda oceani]MBW8243998.1 5-methyltetrahydropteroyltriglutamate--homocysteine S-methyltransferase [Allomuricauda oceani]QII44975.1 5-methyltetrahydropteroyltriglutamate--homocysteine S-methyltransferase [Allomuricauda oceani]